MRKRPDRNLVEFRKRDRPAAHSGPAQPANEQEKPDEANDLVITQTDLISFNLMKMERARLFRKMKKWRTDIQARLARGAEVEPGPHSAEVIQKTIIEIR